jgi:predicted  nucleic acid-binding Zn-ribbon protein
MTHPMRKDIERLKAKIMGVNSQLDALSERLAELPKTLSAAPIYKQMEKLQSYKDEHQQSLEELMAGGQTSLDRIVGLGTFESFANHYRKFITNESDINQRKQLIKKFISKIQLGTDSLNIHFIVDQDHYKQELALTRAGSSPQSKIFRNFGSHTLTNGARNWT